MFIKRILSFVWNKLLFKSSKHLFVSLVNLRNFIKKINVKISYKDSLYLIEENADDKKIKFFYVHKERLLRNINSMQQRAKYLSKIYQLNLINFKDNDLFVDCGANYGEIYIYFNNIINKKINYIGIEPSPNEYNCLLKNINNQKIINKALWNKDDLKLKLYVKSNSADTSLIKINNPENIKETTTVTIDKI